MPRTPAATCTPARDQRRLADDDRLRRSGEQGEPPRGFNLTLVVEDGDAWWSRAVEAGCKVRMPFERMFWGDRWGMVEDPFGIAWGIDETAD